MKKWLILAAALLLAFAAGIKYQQRKASFESAGFHAAQPAPDGAPLPVPAPLPAGATLYSIPENFSAEISRSGAPSTYGALPTIKNKLYESGPCKGGSLNEIFSAHGRIWGYLAPYGSFSNTDNEDTYELLGKYLSCVGLARRDPSFCNYLPGESRGGRTDVPLLKSPNYKCGQYYLGVSSAAGAAGGCPTGQEALCSAYLSKSEASCSALLAKLGSSYCAYLAKAQKRAGGYAGYSPEEVKAVFKKAEEEKAEAERRRKENEKITEEINTRVRKMMGKTDAPK
ncbi:MAG: hypothetical protein PHV36_10330 [Elusimicrobiales bacterium]|nr:hypothetical protein [Elusimicrobiales bacterium]